MFKKSIAGEIDPFDFFFFPAKSVLEHSSCRKHSIEEGSMGEALEDNKVKRIPN